MKRINALLMGVQSQRDVDKLAVPALELYKRCGRLLGRCIAELNLRRAKIATTQETAALYVKACCQAGDSERIIKAFSRGVHSSQRRRG